MLLLLAWLLAPAPMEGIVRPPPLRALVRVAGPADEQLLSRIRGQVTDLAVDVVVERNAQLEEDVPAQVRAAAELAQSRKARVVVWFRHAADGGVTVHVADPADHALLARWVDVFERSARAEAVALIVRLALRALAAGGRIGVTTPPTAEAPPPEPEPVVVEQPAPPAAPPPRSYSFGAVAGWAAVIDGAREPVQQGLAVAVAVENRHGRAALEGILGLPVTMADGLTSVDVARHSAGARLEWLFVRQDALQASLGAGAGVVAFARSAAVALSPDIDPAPAQTTFAFYASPALSGAWRPLRAPLWLELSLGADFVAGAPTLGYRKSGQFAATDHFWPVEPRAAISLVLLEK